MTMKCFKRHQISQVIHGRRSGHAIGTVENCGGASPAGTPQGQASQPLYHGRLMDKIAEYGLITVSIWIMVTGIYFFKFPNHFSMGGVSGLAILLGQAVQVPWLTPSVFNSVLNLFFLVLGFLMLDKAFGLRTVYCTILYSALVQIFEWTWPRDGPLTDQKMLEIRKSIEAKGGTVKK